MRTDREIRADVMAELRWVPDVDDTDLDVEVNQGIVTLCGFVPDHSQRHHAELAARRVRGVTAVANEIHINPDSERRRSDEALAREAVDAIRADQPQLADQVQVVVSAGHLTLEGTVAWHWQRQRLESAMRAIDGVAVVSNLLVVKPLVSPHDLKLRIEEAFVRSAEVDAEHLSVEAQGGEVTLRGTVRSLHEKDEAQRTAWSAPGVTRVVNEISVQR